MYIPQNIAAVNKKKKNQVYIAMQGSGAARDGPSARMVSDVAGGHSRDSRPWRNDNLQI